MTRASDVLPLVQPALVKFITFLTGTPADPAASLDDLAKSYADAKGKQGRDTVAGKIGMNDAELTMFDATLREGVRRVGRLAPDAPSFETRNTTIAALRLLSWLETIADRKAEFGFTVTLPGQDDEIGRKQVRALEMILRSLITERYEDQPALIARLKELLSEKVVQQWLTSADRGDVLSGTTFSELSSLFVSTQEYPNYDPLYKDTPLLTLLKEKRVTIRNYLDDIRRIRNVLAHNKRVSPAQMSLLNMYYDELVEPLQEAHDQGRTKVNPELFLDVSKEELEGYFGSLSQDVKGVKDDIADLRAELGGKIDDVKKDTAAIRETTARIEGGTKAANSKLWVVIAGVVGIAAVVAAILYFVLGTKDTTDKIAGDTAATRDTTARIEDKTDQIGEKTDQIGETTDQIASDTAEIKESIGDIADAFKRIDKNGGVIENPSSPAEHYHNALVYQERGDTANARKEYMAFAEADVDAIDVHDRFAQLLRAQDGTVGAREIYGSLASRLKAPAIKLVYAMQFVDAERTKRVEEFMTANPNYGPGYYLLAQEYSEARTGGQSVNDKQKEFDNLTKFLAADAEGTLVSHFVDVQVLGQWLDTARQRVKVLEPQLSATRSQPTLVQSRNNAGWSVTFIIPEAATQIFYRLGETGEFVDTGSSGMIDQRTGKPAPNSWISLPTDQQSTTIYLKYINMNGQEMGPFALAFEAGTSALGEEHKRMLEMTWTSWILIQANPGNESQQLIYFTGITSWRCGAEKVMYGFNGAGLDTELKLPPCDEKDPMAIPSDYLPYMESPPGLQTMQVQITYKDGTQSAVREYKSQ
jgi:hypothetical protein